MIRERSEIIAFSKEDLERIILYMAKQQVIGGLFIGQFGDQEIRWTVDGGVEVITKYTEGTWDDLPPKQLEAPKEEQGHKRKKHR